MPIFETYRAKSGDTLGKIVRIAGSAAITLLLAGRRRVGEMELWDREFIDLIGPA